MSSGPGAGKPSSILSNRPHAFAILSLLLLQGLLYGTRLHPGAAEGDAAELQWAGPLLGIAHSPGYAFQISLLKLFTSLPIGGDPAWRANVMSAVFGVAGALLLYGAVRRITGNVPAGWGAAALLAFSSIYWSHSLIAEVYVVGGAILAGAVYAAVRFIQEDRETWLWASVLLAGVVIAERPSEILVLPAFAGLGYGFRGSLRIDARRLLIVAVLLVFPFALSIALDILRSDPSRLAARDEVLRDSILGYVDEEVTFDYGAGPGLVDRVSSTASFILGLRWKGRLGLDDIVPRTKKVVWLLTGAGLFGKRLAPAGETDEMLTGGIGFSLPGLVLAALGAWFWRVRPGWILLGLGLVAGNLVFLLLYDTFDNLTFSVPTILGLSLLAGLGIAGPPEGGWKKRKRRLWVGAWMILPVAVLLVNLEYVNRNTPAARNLVEARSIMSSIPFPERSVILTTYWPAMTYRYLLWVGGDRRDMSVIHVSSERDYHKRLARQLIRNGRALYVTPSLVPAWLHDQAILRTEDEVRRSGFIRVDPVVFRQIWGEEL